MSTYFELDKRMARFRKHPKAAGGKPPKKTPVPAPAAVAGNGAKPSPAKAKAASYTARARAFNAPVSYRVPGIVPPSGSPPA